MYPEYDEGDFVIIMRSPFLFGHLTKGDTIIFSHVQYGILIKKIEDVLPSGDLFVKGKQKNSLDSNKLGCISLTSVIGKVIWHIRKN